MSKLFAYSGQVGKWFFIIFIPIVFCLIVFLVVASSFGWNGMYSPHVISIFALPIAFGLIFLGARGAINMLLPRITGGLAIGYFPLLIASEPWYLAVYLAQHPKGWLVEWIIILLMACAYLYREAYPFVLETKKAFWRSFKVLMWATVQSALIGFIFILLSAPVYRQLDFDPKKIDSQPQSRLSITSPSDAGVESPMQEASQEENENKPVDIPGPNSFQNHGKKDEDEKRPVEEGLKPIDFGWLNTNFPVSALLTFAPISLLLGIILQILWEEKTVTSSVWPSESR